MKVKNFEQLKNYLIPVLSIVVVVIMIPLFILPQLSKIAEASKIINKNKNRLSSIEKKATELAELSKNKNDLEEKIKIIEQALPVDKSVAKLVSGIQQLAISSGLRVSTFKIVPGKIATESAKPVSNNSKKTQTNTKKNTGSSEATSAEKNLLFQITLDGGIAQFQTFLTTLEKAKRILVLNEFKSSSQDGKIFKFEVYLRAPYSPLPKLSEDQIGEPIKTLSKQDEVLLNALKSEEFRDVTEFEISPSQTGIVNPF